MAPFKAIAVDMDGTFLDDQKNYDKELFAYLLTKMNKQGIHFIVASGNQYERLRLDFVEHYQDLAFVAENGAYLIDRTQAVLTQALDLDVIKQVVTFKQAYPELHLAACGVKAAYIPHDEETDFVEGMKYYCPKHELIGSLEKLPGDAYLKLTAGMRAEDTKPLLAALQAEFGQVLKITSSGFGSIDLMKKGVNKAQGLDLMLKRWNLGHDDLIAFGDGGNDIEMLNHAKYGYAMENGDPKVKAIADYIAPANNEAGVLQVLKGYLE